MKAGDVVHHLRSARRLFVESVDGRVVFCAWFTTDGALHRTAYGVSWLVEKGTGIA